MSFDEESQSLLSPLSTPPPNESYRNSQLRYQLLRCVCLPSKPAVVFICLAIIVGAVQKIFSVMCGAIFLFVVGGHYVSELWAAIISYLLLSVTVFLYPASGFLADVFCGRFKIMIISMSLFIVSFVLLPAALGLVIVYRMSFLGHQHNNQYIVEYSYHSKFSPILYLSFTKLNFYHSGTGACGGCI